MKTFKVIELPGQDKYVGQVIIADDTGKALYDVGHYDTAKDAYEACIVYLEGLKEMAEDVANA